MKSNKKAVENILIVELLEAWKVENKVKMVYYFIEQTRKTTCKFSDSLRRYKWWGQSQWIE